MKNTIFSIVVFVFMLVLISCNSERSIDIQESVDILKSAYEKTIDLDSATIKVSDIQEGDYSDPEHDGSYIIYESGCSYNKSTGGFVYYCNFNESGEWILNSSVNCVPVDNKYQLYLDAHKQDDTYKIMQEIPEQYHSAILNGIDIHGVLYESDFACHELFDDILYNISDKYGEYRIESVVKIGKEYIYEIEYAYEIAFGSNISHNVEHYTLKITDGIINCIETAWGTIEIEAGSRIAETIDKSDYTLGVVENYIYFGYGY